MSTLAGSAFLLPVLFFEVALIQNVPLPAAGWDLPRQRGDLAADHFVELGLTIAVGIEPALDLVQREALVGDLGQPFAPQRTHDFMGQVREPPLAETDHSVKPRSLARRALMPSTILR